MVKRRVRIDTIRRNILNARKDWENRKVVYRGIEILNRPPGERSKVAKRIGNYFFLKWIEEILEKEMRS